MKILTLLLTFALAFPAWAEELEYFPGWKINKIEQAENEDGSISSGPEYYGLTPPDERPPVSIDARTARALKAGEAQPEEVYGKLAGKSGKSEGTAAAGETYEYSAGNNGFVQADTINSTLPGYVAEPVASRNGFRRGGDSFGAGDTASYGSSGSSVAGGYAVSDYEGAPQGGYAGANPSSGSEGSVTSALKSAAGAASPAATQASARAKQLALNSSSPSSLASSGLNVKSGFDALSSGGKGTSGGSGSGGKDGRTPASDDEDAPPPPCNKGRFVYEKSTHVRVKLPIGCGLIHMSAWGAGGGSGLQIYQSGGRDDSGTQSVREISGSGASFMSTSWEIDARKYDLIVVVGDPGGKAKQKTTVVKDDSNDGGGTRTVITLEGGDGGGPDGKDGAAGGGGGGGGYSGVFLVAKNDTSTTVNKSRAMVVAAGGSGGGNGGAGGNLSVPSSAPDARMTNQIGEKNKGTKAGFHYYFERNGAGSPGNSGKVILEYY